MHQRLRISLLVLAAPATGLAADDSLHAPAELAADLADGRWKPACSAGFDLPFVAPETADLVRFVCTPGGSVTPCPATWLLK